MLGLTRNRDKTEIEELDAPLDRAHQEAFVFTVQEAARLLSVLAVGVVVGLVLAWVQGIRR